MLLAPRRQPLRAKADVMTNAVKYIGIIGVAAMLGVYTWPPHDHLFHYGDMRVEYPDTANLRDNNSPLKVSH